MVSMNHPSTENSAQLMLVPGGTSMGAVTMTYSAMHKLWELYEHFEKTGMQRRQRIVVAPREMTEALPSRAEASNAALQARIKQMPASTDVILETSGSTTGEPRLVGLSFGAMVASARATHEFLGGPGRWIVALPVHHVAGLQTLVRSCVAEASPIIADMSSGFDALALERAARTAADDPNLRGYLSLVPKQLSDALEVGGELVTQLARLDAVLIGGSALSPALLDRAREAGIHVVTTYGMTETGGGCVYDGQPLPGVKIRVKDGRVQIAGPMLMDAYLDERYTHFVEEDGERWLATADAAEFDGRLTVLGRADDVIISGSVNIAPTRVLAALEKMDGVREASVVALPDDTWGQVVAAAIVAPEVFEKMKEGDAEEVLAAFAQKVREQVGAELGRDHAPRVIAVVEELPRTTLGKVDRSGTARLLTDLVATRKAWVR